MRYWTLAVVGVGLLGLGIRQKYKSEPIEHKIVELRITRNDPTPAETKIKVGTKLLPLGHGICSGEFIDSRGDILTAHHCTEGTDSIQVQTYDGRMYDATIIAESKIHDLAIIRIDRQDTPFFRLATTLTRGETVYTLGSPLGITDTLSKGILANIGGDALLLDCSFLPGNSGGPVFNERKELIGNVTAVFTIGFGVTHLGMAQSVDAIRSFINQVLYK